MGLLEGYQDAGSTPATSTIFSLIKHYENSKLYSFNF